MRFGMRFSAATLLAVSGLRFAGAADLPLNTGKTPEVRAEMPKKLKEGQIALIRLSSGMISVKAGTGEFQGGTLSASAQIQLPLGQDNQFRSYGEKKAFTLNLSLKKNPDGSLVVLEKGGGPDRGDLAVGSYTVAGLDRPSPRITLTFSGKLTPPKDWGAPSLPFGPVTMELTFGPIKQR
jgi:hypothetical protein